MPVESATYLNQLVATNPLHTDGLDEADSHMRLIKQVILNTLPNLGTVANCSAADLNAITGAYNAADGAWSVAAPRPADGNVGGQLMLEGASGQTDILISNAGGQLVFYAGNSAGGTSTAWTEFGAVSTAGAMTLTGAFNATSIQKGGYELLPVGTILMWYGSVANIPAGWSLCNGANGTPNLTGSFILHADGSTYVPGQTGGTAGSLTATTSTAGLHNHGGLDGLAGAYTPTGVTDVQGSHEHTGQTGATALTLAQIPAHTHPQMVSATPGPGGNAATPTGGGGNGSMDAALSTDYAGSGGYHIHTISYDGSHQHNLEINALPNHQHTISEDGSHSHTVSMNAMPPFYALCYIMKTT
jgi:hypothetical protein